MQDSFEIDAEIRSDLGKGASRRLRRLDLVPAIIYGGSKEPQNLTLVHKDLVKHLEHESFYSHILNIKIDGKNQKSVLRAVHRHPSKAVILHVDFLRVDEKEKLKMSVPLHFLNEEACVGVKTDGGLITRSATQVEVQCLIKDLPEYLEIDLIDVKLGDSVHLSDIKLPAGVELMEIIHGHDLSVANVIKPRAVIEESDEAPAAPTTDGADAPAEGDDGDSK